ncbi:hypothetical protein [Peterkaempfera griseoplana]|uniref:hypothetical protein n=1 Tax=Peterkaempfera griseoplana TaxID=66896 RepID=UPI0006E35396|nr:hypothetical protein [Peterkaempfera griseoplana]
MPRRVSLPGADELFRTTGGMALSPSLARQQDASRSEAARGAGTAQGGAAGGEQRPPEDDGQYAERPRHAGDDDTAEEHGSAAGVDAQAGRRVLGQGTPGQGGRTPGVPSQSSPGSDGSARRKSRSAAARRPSGRERHDEKITVYVSAEELMDLEHARLVLRGEHGLAVDRGRIVREAVAVVLADLEQRGEASILVRRLRGR